LLGDVLSRRHFVRRRFVCALASNVPCCLTWSVVLEAVSGQSGALLSVLVSGAVQPVSSQFDVLQPVSGQSGVLNPVSG
jgi:hypothetical protein